MIKKELIERFFRNDCSIEEQQQVLEYFKANPSEFEQYLDENEWEHFVAGEEMHPALSKKLFENVRRQTTGRARTIRAIRRIAIAASILLVIGFGWIFMRNGGHPEPTAQYIEKKADSVRFVVRHEVNKTGKEKSIALEDGSLIVLANNSEITYRQPFTDRREFTLTGKAYFKVAKNNKPFSVFSGELSTTALGTEFTVTAFQNTNRIIVRLYEGKVVVKAANKVGKGIKKDVYLLPGQEFVYGGSLTTAKVKAFNVKNAAPEKIMNEELTQDNPSVPEKVETPYFMFNNQPLSQVLNDFAALYNVKIVFDKNDVDNIYFTGKYDRSESIERILGRIGTLNNLKVTKKDSAYILSK